jgi:hypothetical protein
MDLEMNPTEEPDELEEKMEKEDELEQTSVLPMHWKVGGGLTTRSSWSRIAASNPLCQRESCRMHPRILTQTTDGRHRDH